MTHNNGARYKYRAGDILTARDNQMVVVDVTEMLLESYLHDVDDAVRQTEDHPQHVARALPL